MIGISRKVLMVALIGFGLNSLKPIGAETVNTVSGVARIENGKDINKDKKENMVKKLYRSRTDKKIAGVCAGFANYFEIDPAFVRLLFIALGCFGVGIIFYIAAWILIPLED